MLVLIRPGRGLRIAGAVVLALLLSGAGVLTALRPVDRAGGPRIVYLPKGVSSAEIGRRLQAAGLVRWGQAFVVAAQLRGVARTLREGEYELSPAMTLLGVMDKIARGDVVLHTVTIPEGFTAEEIVDALVLASLGERSRLRTLVAHGAGEFSHPFLHGMPVASLEGYLFPDTYRLPRYVSEREILGVFLDRFAQVVLPRWQRYGAGRPVHEIVTVASMVEREAKEPAERPLIAGVIYNRLRRGWRLEVDATVLYALGRHKPVVTSEDLKVDSPYNTYLQPGLPPGPIASPGLAAIDAALQPQATDFLYYVARPDGSHAFSRTLAEHHAAVRRYRTRP